MSGLRRSQETVPVGRRRVTGVLLLIAVGALLVLAYVRPNPFADTQTVRAVFDDAAGLGVVAGEVRMAGVPVGRIADVRRVGDDALLELELGPEAGTIRTDATAELRPRIAFEGTAFVELHPGSPGRRALGDSAIPRSQTRNYVALDQALRFGRPATREDIAATVRDLGQGLRGKGRTGLQGTLRAAPQLTRDLATGARAARGPDGVELEHGLRELASTMDALARSESDLAPLMRGAASTFAAIDTDAGRPLDATLRRLAPALAELDAGGRALDGIVAGLEPLARELRPGMRELRPTLDRLGPVLRKARPVLADTRPFVSDVRRALRAGGRAAAPAGDLLKALDPSLRLLRSSLLPALHAPTALGMPTYLQFMALFQGGGGASRPFQTPETGTPPENFGTGHFMRFGARFFTGAGFPEPSCALLARADRVAARRAAAAGVCAP